MSDAIEVSLTRRILASNQEMGRAAAREVGELLRRLTNAQERPVMAMFAAAPSQDTFLDALCAESGIRWDRVEGVHLDEYVDLERGHPNTFEAYLREHLFGRVPIPDGNVHYVKEVEGASAEETAVAYERRLRSVLDRVRAEGGAFVACIGIGVNGHIAFNEPHVDKRTGRMVVPVEIDATSVQQQYDDYRDHPDPAARYGSLDDVPRRAVTVTCAGILAADGIFCMVPGEQKARAVKAMWDGPVTDDVPASLLRLHPEVRLYLDEASAALLDRAPELDATGSS